jgi:hypothetical protein
MKKILYLKHGFHIGPITIAGGGDSFYEYLIKNYILQKGKNRDLLNIWEDAVESIEEYMLSPTAENPNIKYVTMISNSTVHYSSQELVSVLKSCVYLFHLTDIHI